MAGVPAHTSAIEAAYARRAVALLDLTSLGEDETVADIEALCGRARTPCGAVAAVCVWPRFIPTARAALAGTSIAVAAVTNFPGGGDNVRRAAAETATAVEAGAQEIDVVFPYHAWLWGNHAVGTALVRACRRACGSRVRLKVILETGQLAQPSTITAAAHCALAAGADFIKTSTGKTAVSATPQAAALMLEAIRAHGAGGFKAAGGIRDTAGAIAYLQLAERILGAEWITPETFRFGASGLLDALLASLGAAPPGTQAAGY